MSRTVIFQAQRDLIARVTEALPQDALLAVPEGRKNNIAWNLGHIVTIQRQLTHSLSGQPHGLPESYPGLFGKDTSPKDWENPPNIDEIFALLRTSGEGFEEDLAAGKFENFKPYTMSLTGITLNSIEEAADFNIFHEGIHFGFIVSILRELGMR